MKKLLGAMLGAVLILGACGGNDNNTDDAAPADNGNQTENAAGDVTYDADNAEDVYVGKCAGCHGGDLGGGSGPGIAGLSYDAVLAAIQEGPGTMPAGLATGDDAEDVAAWIADQ